MSTPAPTTSQTPPPAPRSAAPAAGQSSGQSSHRQRAINWIMNNGALVGLIVLCIAPVSYTHLTLPTNREV